MIASESSRLKAPVAFFTGPFQPAEGDVTRCVRCGLCLNACPTYLVLGSELDSPRGRLAYIRALAEGELQPTPAVNVHLDRCLQCRACEAVCPSGVPFGRLMEATLDEIDRRRKLGWLARFIRWLVLRQLLPYPRRLRLLARLLWLYQRLQLQRLVRASRLLERWPLLAAMDGLLPPLPARPFVPDDQEWPARGASVRRVALFSGCVMSLVYAPTHAATVRVLTRNGCTVVAPHDQLCCGAVHSHNGDIAGAQELARRNILAFERAGVEVVIANAAGCGAALKEYGELLRSDPRWAARAAAFSARVYDVTEFLAALPLVPPRGVLRRRVTYQNPCHLGNAQRIVRAPRDLLRAIPGLELVEMREADICCGSAGIYNLTQPALAGAILDRKMAAIVETGAEQVVSANVGCQMQLSQGLRRLGRRDGAVHVVDLLDESYRRAESTAGGAEP